MSNLIYDISQDNIFSTRFSSIFTTIIFVFAFCFCLYQREKEKKQKKEKNYIKYEKFIVVGKIAVVVIFSSFILLFDLYEASDVFNNYFVEQYKNGYYETVSSKVTIYEQSNELSFSVDNTNFICVSSDYNSHGYHIEDYKNNPFYNNDVIKVYYVYQTEPQAHYYPEKVIVRIEKETQNYWSKYNKNYHLNRFGYLISL